jgi:hypothetical protein
MIDLPSIMNRFEGAVIAIGTIVLIWGAIQFVMAWQDGFSGGGVQVAKALGMVAAGAIIIVLAAVFGQIDWSWAA